MKNQKIKKDNKLKVQIIFEPNRLELESLATAYEEIVPIIKKQTQVETDKFSALPKGSRLILGGVA